MVTTITRISVLSLIVGTMIIFYCSLKQDSSSAANGNELYMQHCATCHGTDLRGHVRGVHRVGDRVDEGPQENEQQDAPERPAHRNENSGDSAQTITRRRIIHFRFRQGKVIIGARYGVTELC